jgi:hypothetical protein
MRIRLWGRGFEAHDLQAVPEIYCGENEVEGAFAMLRISGVAYPHGRDEQARVKILHDEWPVLRSRIDAAFNGEDPNTGTFAGTTYREVETKLCTNEACSIGWYNAELHEKCPSCGCR